jgi:5-methyltetrahydrofolate--homocysteine methyltransferase
MSAQFMPLAEARANKLPLSWEDYTPPVPRQLGIKILADYSLASLIPYIDWTPFFKTWELPGHYPGLLEDASVGAEARRLYADAQELLQRIVAENLLHAQGVVGMFPASTVADDDIAVYGSDEREQVLVILHHLRQQTVKTSGNPNRCLSDFLAPVESGLHDYLGCFAVTAGIGLPQLVEKFEQEHDDYSAIMAKALADRLAEAFAEHLHERVRREFWGYAEEEQLDNVQLIKERYRGIRPAPGYPACPDHTEKTLLFELLAAPKNAGIRLTENYAMLPASSVCGTYFSHPESHYFGVGKIAQDQVEDYARRKGASVPEIERTLAPVLGY